MVFASNQDTERERDRKRAGEPEVQQRFRRKKPGAGLLPNVATTRRFHFAVRAAGYNAGESHARDKLEAILRVTGRKRRRFFFSVTSRRGLDRGVDVAVTYV